MKKLLQPLLLCLAGSSIVHKAAASPDFADFDQDIPGSELNIPMVAVTGGTFRMGSDTSEPGHQASEAPARDVTVADFYNNRSGR